jgi:hypothetical protein
MANVIVIGVLERLSRVGLRVSSGAAVSGSDRLRDAGI